jgi:GH24 family phage-related lysozyme (muramidase)
MTITEAEAERLLRGDLDWVEAAIADLVKAPLTQNQYDALASFIFNIGRTQFSNSTMLKLLNAKDYEGATAQFPRWNKQKGRVLKGLTNRRNQEQQLFLS